MYARVVTFEGAGAAAMEETAKQIQEGERPEGIPATAFYFLGDRASGKTVTIGLFETEEDLQKGHETLSAMNPPGEGFGRRVSVDLMEVLAHMTE